MSKLIYIYIYIVMCIYIYICGYTDITEYTYKHLAYEYGLTQA